MLRYIFSIFFWCFIRVCHLESSDFILLILFLVFGALAYDDAVFPSGLSESCLDFCECFGYMDWGFKFGLL